MAVLRARHDIVGKSRRNEEGRGEERRGGGESRRDLESEKKRTSADTVTRWEKREGKSKKVVELFRRSLT